HSPFNVGLSMELPSFNHEQVLELAQRYGLESAETYTAPLIDLLGGNPYLTQLALYHISTKEITLEQLQKQAIAADGIFGSHLRQQLAQLQLYPELLSAFEQMIHASEPIDLNPIAGFKLQSMGLIQFSNLQAMTTCRLYRWYFETALRTLSVASF
ncbi:MAG TPA: AAA-like domain-containing protein, partial [Coleofasciculaceae cyanobacterium]